MFLSRNSLPLRSRAGRHPFQMQHLLTSGVCIAKRPTEIIHGPGATDSNTFPESTQVVELHADTRQATAGAGGGGSSVEWQDAVDGELIEGMSTVHILRGSSENAAAAFSRYQDALNRADDPGALQEQAAHAVAWPTDPEVAAGTDHAAITFRYHVNGSEPLPMSADLIALAAKESTQLENDLKVSECPDWRIRKSS
jgi:hypothetical protein